MTITFTGEEFAWILFNTPTYITPAEWTEKVQTAEQYNPAAQHFRAIPLWMVPRLAGWEGYHIQLPPAGSPQEWAILWTKAAWLASRTRNLKESYVDLEVFKTSARLRGLQLERMERMAQMIRAFTKAVDVSPFLPNMLVMHQGGGEESLAYHIHKFEEFAGGGEVFYIAPSPEELDLQAEINKNKTRTYHEKSIEESARPAGSGPHAEAAQTAALAEEILKSY